MAVSQVRLCLIRYVNMVTWPEVLMLRAHPPTTTKSVLPVRASTGPALPIHARGVLHVPQIVLKEHPIQLLHLQLELIVRKQEPAGLNAGPTTCICAHCSVGPAALSWCDVPLNELVALLSCLVCQAPNCDCQTPTRRRRLTHSLE